MLRTDRDYLLSFLYKENRNVMFSSNVNQQMTFFSGALILFDLLALIYWYFLQFTMLYFVNEINVSICMETEDSLPEKIRFSFPCLFCLSLNYYLFTYSK